MTQSDKETLKWLLVEAKAIVDEDSPNPYIGIFLNNLCEVIGEFAKERAESILGTKKGGVSLGQNGYEVDRNPNIA